MEILLIDDIPEKAGALANFLEERGAMQHWVTNEKAAKDLLKTGSDYAAIFLDMAMPRSDKDKALNKYSGINILNFMKVYKISIPVVVITLYWDFVSLEAQENSDVKVYSNMKVMGSDSLPEVNDLSKIRYLDMLHYYMSQRYANYIGAVKYSNVNNKWKLFLESLLTHNGGKAFENFTIRE